MHKVAIIGSVGVPARYGGFETLAEKLVDHLSEDLQITVYCSGLQYSKKLESYKNAKLEYVGLSANGIQSIPYDIISIKRAYDNHDVLLILGVAGIIALPFLKLKKAKPKIVVHIDGMEWKREKWKWFAKLYLKYSEVLALIISNKIVADNNAILDNVPNRFIKKTALITYGGDHVINAPKDQEVFNRLEVSPNNYAFGVCRIVPENNIRTILESFRRTNESIIFVGNWYDSNYGIDIWREYHEDNNIDLIHPIYDQKTLDVLRSNCSAYIHGHSAGGTNPSLVEAMYLKLKILCFDVDFNRNTLGRKGIFFKSVDELVNILENKEELEDYREYHYNYANKEYSWKNICNKYHELFNSL